MDTTYGVLCLIPPIVAIGLALWTKQTIFSLFIAVWLGSTMMNGFNPLVGFVKIISDYMIPSLSGNASLIILVTLSGGMIAMLRTTGAAEAFATRVTKVINTAKKGQIVTCLSAFIFSYTEPCLMLGTIMRPVTDMVRISRAKLEDKDITGTLGQLDEIGKQFNVTFVISVSLDKEEIPEALHGKISVAL